MTQKLLRKGCKAYLNIIINFASLKLTISDIRTVKDFSNVFPNELPRVAPTLEVKFWIDLIPSTATMYIAPYRMAPKKLVELKAQL